MIEARASQDLKKSKVAEVQRERNRMVQPDAEVCKDRSLPC